MKKIAILGSTGSIGTQTLEVVRENKDIVFAYPIYFSNLPKIVRDFIEINDKEFNGKNIFDRY